MKERTAHVVDVTDVSVAGTNDLFWLVELDELDGESGQWYLLMPGETHAKDITGVEIDADNTITFKNTDTDFGNLTELKVVTPMTA
jgi:hypothetical protein